MLTEFIRSTTTVILSDGAPDTGSATATIALYSMISALGVAMLGIFGQIVVARITGGSRSRNADRAVARVSREHEAWERWFLLNDIDPRKIKTGYETMAEVHHAAP